MLKIGIFFGGPSREREISFAGGKTAMDNIDQSLFQPVPVFVDGLGNFILLKLELVYSSSIRDFFPPKSVQGDFNVYI
ncbi:MAG: D-alanine--D-alanine ligase, partial [Pseudarcicella sp.]|nr:D-alanine--D-alanine ligase [Pseudarcicella sp.]